MDMQGAMTAVEQAAQGLALPSLRANAEATLLEFRRSPHALPACRHILEHSQVTEAQFQAASTLRDAALRDWTALPPQERSGLRQFCLGALLHRTPPPAPVVASQLMSTLAVILKRAWLDEGVDRGAMLSEAEAAVTQASTATARRIGLQLFAAVISEFSPTTASAMQLPWEFHERCRASLETEFLAGLFAHGSQIARSVAESGAALNATDDSVCVASLRLMSAALAWDFTRDGAAGGPFGFIQPEGHLRPSGNDRDGEAADAVRITPGTGWRETLLAPGAMDWLFRLNTAAFDGASRGASASGGHSKVEALASAARGVVASLCALSGDVFPSAREEPGGETRRRHFAACVRALRAVLSPANAAVALAASGSATGEENFEDGARALCSLAEVHPVEDFVTPPGAMPGCNDVASANDQNALGMLGELTLALIAAGALRGEHEGGAMEESLRMLLDAWGSLIGRVGQFGCPPELANGAAAVFQAYLHGGLAAVAESAYDDDDGQEEEGKAGAAALDERLSLIAPIARAAPDATLPLLRQALDAKKQALAATTANGADPTTALEELWWLGRLVPHVLADAFDGEIPLPPDSLAECRARATHEERECPVDALAGEYVQLTCLCLDENARRAMSPRLLETLTWGSARWADTYLMSEDTGGSLHAAIFAHNALGGGGEGRVYRGANKAKPAAFSEAGGGAQVLDALLRAAFVCLTAWPGETGVQKAAASTLLPALTRRRALCRTCVNLPAWKQVMDAESVALAHSAAVAGAVPGQQTLHFPPEIHLGLSEALGRAAEGLNDEAQSREYIARVLAPVGQVLEQVAAAPGDMKHPAGEQRAVAVIQALRGSVRATIARSQASVFSFFSQSFEALLAVQRAGAHSAQVSKLILKLTEELVANQACFLGPAHAGVLCRHCLRVVEEYRASGRGKIGAAEGGSRSLRAERVKECYKEVKAMLRMLTHVTNSDNDVEDEETARGGSHRGSVLAAAAAGAAASEGRVRGGAGVAATSGEALAKVDVAQVVFIGLNTVIPLITDELLTFPKLCHQYFALLAHMLEAYPAKVAALPPDMFNSLMGTLEFGLKHADVEVARESLAAAGAMGSFQHHASVDGRPGLGDHNARAGGDFGILARLMRTTLSRMIFEDAGMDLVDAAADALLPLMLVERAAFEGVAGELLAKLEGDAGAQARVMGALRELTTGNGLTDRVDRANKRRFRRNMSTFLTETRSFVRHN